ncbi:MAG: SDR family oxidoreductase [Thermoguttaceae bacterium]|nr:SDR family oxidoreductase [Thermoguttaceae bacterium]
MSTIRSLTVITGATGGIGSAIARRLAGRGGALLLHGHTNTAALSGLSEELGARACTADLLTASGRGVLFSAFEDWAETYPDAESVSFVFAAGADLMTPAMKSLPFEERARRAAELDLFAPVILARRFAGWRTGRRGSGVSDAVLFFSWDGAFRGMEGETAQVYALTKGGLAAFAQSFAQDQAGRMRVLTISPGWIATAWGKKAGAAADQRVSRESLSGRWGTPEETADLAAFLLSDQARYLNAVNIPLNGGFSNRK